MSIEKVQAQHLKVGDRIPGRYGVRVVTHEPSNGLKTPSGKVELGLDGYKATWGARTEIAVERAEQVAA